MNHEEFEQPVETPADPVLDAGSAASFDAENGAVAGTPADGIPVEPVAATSVMYCSLLGKLPFLHPGRRSPTDPSSADKIYVFGNLEYSFSGETRRDSFLQAYRAWFKRKHGGEAGELDEHLQEFLEDQPWLRTALTWVLNVDQAPFYAIQPGGNHAEQAHDLLVRYYFEEFWDRKSVSIAGRVVGKTKLVTGEWIPVIRPAIGGMEVWSKRHLMHMQDEDKMRALLDLVHDQIRNPGIEAGDRAINFAVTDAFRLISGVAGKIEGSGYGLSSILVSPSPMNRRGSQCYDVKIRCFKFQDPTTIKFFRLTIDVREVVPTRIGDLLSWKSTGY